MPPDTQQLVGLIVEAIEDYDPPALAEHTEQLGAETVLFGETGLFDSLGLVGLIVDVEQRISEELGAEVVLGDDRAMSQKHSPFRTVGTLAEYASSLTGADA